MPLCLHGSSIPYMGDWLAQVGELPAALRVAALGVVMVLDAIPLLGVLVPGDVALLTAVGASGPGGGSAALLAVIGGCLTGWSLSFLAGRHFGDRLRGSRVGGWIGEARWAAAEEVLGRGGGRMIVVAPFLPVLNALMPLAAGGLRMPYRRFVSCAVLGSALWAGLYLVLGLSARSLGGFLPGESFTMLATVAIGLAFGWIVLLGLRRRLGVAAQPAVESVVTPPIPGQTARSAGLRPADCAARSALLIETSPSSPGAATLSPISHTPSPRSTAGRSRQVYPGRSSAPVR